MQVSEVNRNRSTIIVPAGNGDGEGWVSFRDILADINEGMQSLEPDENTSAGFQEGDHLSHALGRSLMSGHENSGAMSRILRVEQKKFYFDLGRNARGQYLKVSEVTGPDRSSIVLPVSALEQFHEIIGQFLASVKTEETSVDVDSSAIGPPAPSRSWTED
ncbi:hypothetical protein KP509_18G018000 [Ceratopteris richardii]|uniref:PurA ssDNA and RNA-binding protein n=1 Tax=Ceratopteris richardii TaxID=49495 RepID=A0A8T2SNP0_CERRI|nr:hypothetical protein KP509_18G018000 [Ceratopteris richardii]